MSIYFKLNTVKYRPHLFYSVLVVDDDDEFNDQSPMVMGQCRAIYDYAASQYDELTIKPGACVCVHVCV